MKYSIVEIMEAFNECAKELEGKDKEIERLQEELKDYELTKKEWNDLFDENMKLHSSIKEVLAYLDSSDMSFIDKNEIAIRLKGSDKE